MRKEKVKVFNEVPRCVVSRKKVLGHVVSQFIVFDLKRICIFPHFVIVSQDIQLEKKNYALSFS